MIKELKKERMLKSMKEETLSPKSPDPAVVTVSILE